MSEDRFTVTLICSVCGRSFDRPDGPFTPQSIRIEEIKPGTRAEINICGPVCEEIFQVRRAEEFARDDHDPMVYGEVKFK